METEKERSERDTYNWKPFFFSCGEPNNKFIIKKRLRTLLRAMWSSLLLSLSSKPSLRKLALVVLSSLISFSSFCTSSSDVYFARFHRDAKPIVRSPPRPTLTCCIVSPVVVMKIPQVEWHSSTCLTRPKKNISSSVINHFPKSWFLLRWWEVPMDGEFIYGANVPY